jgi:hypothetical protein
LQKKGYVLHQQKVLEGSAAAFEKKNKGNKNNIRKEAGGKQRNLL